ncbi:MAG: glycosyltransferase [Candidatus Competibacteraceae bacterium]|nr:glycosyltransferase [Candidatus Competibacteraceae bacterium]
METLTECLAGRCRFHVIGIGYKGPVKSTLDGLVTIYPCNLNGGDVYGAYQLKQRIQELKPDVVFLLNDIWMFENYGKVCATEAASIPFVAYAAIDGKIADPAFVNGLSFLNRLVAYTDFSRHELQSAFQQSDNYSQAPIPELAVIGHGVDTESFYPLSGRIALKRKWFPQLPDPENAFVVLNANRPQPRKRIDLSIQAFAQFCKNKPANVLLYLHHAIMTAEEKSQLQYWIKQAAISDRVILSDRAMDDHLLNELYNACDVGLNTAMGEGWGLVSFEHAATGAVQIVPRHSACAELWEERAVLVEPVSRGVPSFSPLEMAEVSMQGVAEALELLYHDTEQRKRLANAGYQFVTQPAFQWPTIAEQWRTLFQTLNDHTT